MAWETTPRAVSCESFQAYFSMAVLARTAARTTTMLVIMVTSSMISFFLPCCCFCFFFDISRVGVSTQDGDVADDGCNGYDCAGDECNSFHNPELF